MLQQHIAAQLSIYQTQAGDLSASSAIGATHKNSREGGYEFARKIFSHPTSKEYDNTNLGWRVSLSVRNLCSEKEKQKKIYFTDINARKKLIFLF